MSEVLVQLPCTCALGCAGADACEAVSTQEDMLCDQCRAAKALDGNEHYFHCHDCGDTVRAASELEVSAIVAKIVAAARGEHVLWTRRNGTGTRCSTWSGPG